MMASNLKQYKSDLSRWKFWKKALESNLNYEPLRKPIEESLKDLRIQRPNLYRYFEELVIFIDNVNIPVKVSTS